MDQSNLARMIDSVVDMMAKTPELSRCSEAFKLIKNSRELIEKNFNEYASCVDEAGPLSFVQSFVMDIYDTKPSMQAAMQLRRILTFVERKCEESGTKTFKKQTKFADDLLNLGKKCAKNTTDETEESENKEEVMKDYQDVMEKFKSMVQDGIDCDEEDPADEAEESEEDSESSTDSTTSWTKCDDAAEEKRKGPCKEELCEEKLSSPSQDFVMIMPPQLREFGSESLSSANSAQDN